MERWQVKANYGLTLGFFLAPIVAYLLVKAGIVEGVPFIGALLAVLGMIALLIVKTVAFGVIEYVVDHRELRRNLADPAATARMGRPDVALLAVGVILSLGSLPFLLFATTVVALADDVDACTYIGSGTFAMALVFQLVGLQRLSDYFLSRRAWREVRGRN